MYPAVALRRAATWLLRGGAGAPRAASSAALPGLGGGARSLVRGWQAREAGGFLGIWGGPAAGVGGGGGSWWFRCAASSLSRPGLLVEQLLVGGGRSFATGAAPEEVSFSPAAREADGLQPENSAATSDQYVSSYLSSI